MNYFLRSIGISMLSLLLLRPTVAQTFYSQNFSTGLGGWTSSNATAITVNNTSPSSGYSAPITASGGNNLSFGECGGNSEHIATSDAISTVGRTNLMVGFGRRKTAAFGPQVVIFEFSINGGTSWNNISSDVSSVASTTWNPSVFNLPVAAENQASLTFRLRYTPPGGSACATSFRIDDFTVSENGALPVEFSYFQAKLTGTNVQLSWETNWERGASHFIVERSVDANDFSAIGRVNAVGNATTRQLYTFTDGEPLKGISYYRLRQVDTDGAERLSKISFVSQSVDQLVVCDNPTSGHEIRLKVSHADPNTLQLHTVTGQMPSFQLTQQTETDWFMRPTVPLTPGLYLIRVGQNNQRRIIKFIVR